MNEHHRFFAVANGHEVVVRLLLAIDGVNPDSKDSDGETLLSLATANGYLLLEKRLSRAIAR